MPAVERKETFLNRMKCTHDTSLRGLCLTPRGVPGKKLKE